MDVFVSRATTRARFHTWIFDTNRIVSSIILLLRTIKLIISNRHDCLNMAADDVTREYRPQHGRILSETGRRSINIVESYVDFKF